MSSAGKKGVTTPSGVNLGRHLVQVKVIGELLVETSTTYMDKDMKQGSMRGENLGDHIWRAVGTTWHS